MKLSKGLKAFMEKASLGDSYWVEQAKLSFAIALEQRCRKAGMTGADLARKIDSSAAYVSKVFRGDTNFTIETMVKLSRATGGRLEMHIVDTSSTEIPWTRSLLQAKRSNPVAVNSTVTYVDFAAANHDKFGKHKVTA